MVDATTLLSFIVLGSLITILIQFVGWYYKPKHYYKRHARKVLRRIEHETDLNKKVEILRSCHGLVFEELVILILKRCKNVPRCGATGFTRDGGFDGFADSKQGRKRLKAGIQSKRYHGYIKLDSLHQFNRVCRRQMLVPLFMYTGLVSRKCLDYAQQNGIRMFNGSTLLRLIEHRTLELGE